MAKRRYYWVLVGDFGGQIYATFPTHSAKICREKLALALDYISRVECPEDYGREDGAGDEMYQIRGRAGRVIPGGMGGGLLADGLWMHPDLQSDLKEWLPKFISGEIDTDPNGYPTGFIEPGVF